MTAVFTYSYTHSVTYVTDNILKSLKDIIRLSGLDPAQLVDGWESNKLALTTWLDSGDLQYVVLEIYNPDTDKLIYRWDIYIKYSWDSGEDSFWTDTEQLKYAIQKTGVVPSKARYRLLMQTKKGRPNVQGWGDGSYRPTENMVKQSLGSTVDHHGLGAQAAYWRNV